MKNYNNLYSKINYEVTIDAVEPNEKARINLLEQNIATKIYPSIEDVETQYDLVFTSGVLIHIHPEELLNFTKNIYKLSSKYVICAEYFRPEPEVISYRGQKNALFIRDFGSFYLDNFPLSCISFGFAWKRLTYIDNLNWFVFKKAH